MELENTVAMSVADLNSLCIRAETTPVKYTAGNAVSDIVGLTILGGLAYGTYRLCNGMRANERNKTDNQSEKVSELRQQLNDYKAKYGE